jgi:hypothetical protein
MRTATQLASTMMQVCSDHTREGTIWPVDANLRPEGKSGPLVRSIASHVGYYERWAKTWEFQALLKARPVAGDLAVGRAYCDAVQPMVWQASSRANFVDDVQAMRRRVEQHIPPAEADRQLKLGPGGLRDVEFSVQLLQLVHGRSDETLRTGTTLDGLAALSAGGYVGREDAATLSTAYRLLSRVPANPRPLSTVKDAAYAWRQMLFFLSLTSTEAQAHALAGARDVAAGGPSHVGARLTPAFDGLAHVLAGGEHRAHREPTAGHEPAIGEHDQLDAVDRRRGGLGGDARDGIRQPGLACRGVPGRVDAAHPAASAVPDPRAAAHEHPLQRREIGHERRGQP